MAEEKKYRPQRDLENQPAGREVNSGRERTLDKTLEDSYPASDPPSSIPDPEEDSEAA